MAIQVLNNGDTLGTQRGKINSNFSDLDSRKPDVAAVLTKTNTTAYTPTKAYHPATKSFAESLIAAWHNVFNPQDISKDVFARASHTGDIDPDWVAEDSVNRFVSDNQITSWNSKEDGIGTKNSAFNKNFGPGNTDVSRGDHSHTKADVGLDQVDNTADADKGISNATQEALDEKVSTGDQNSVPLNAALATPPAYKEGLIFYDPLHNAVSGYCDVAGITINFGFEFLIRVWNGTGATILNGQAVRSDGVDLASSQANAVLAQANTFENSIVMGLATHDIPNNTVGYVCNHGGVHDFDTTGFPAGSTVYLSADIPGMFTLVPPAIITKIGEVRKSHALTGTVFVEIQNAIIIPTLFGQLYDKAGTMNLSTSYQDVEGYTNESAVTLTTDITNGTIAIPNDGKYRMTCSISMTVPSKASTREMIIRLYDETAAAEVVHSGVSIPKDSTNVSRSFSPPFDAVAGHVYKIQVWADEAITGVVFADISFDVQSISAI